MSSSPAASWSDSFKVYAHPRVIGMFLLGFSAGLPLILVLGTLSFWLLQYLSGALRTAVLYAGGSLMMGGILSLNSSFSSTFQDHIPAGYEGRYQGVRMCFMVLVPMIVGPIISLFVGLDAMGFNGDNFVPPYSIFLAAAIVAVTALFPIVFIRKDAAKAG